MLKAVACAAQQQLRLLLVEPQVSHADLLQPPPGVRQRASGRAGASRLATAICDPVGTNSRNATSTSRQDGFSTACRSSRTSTIGRSRAARALLTCGTPVDQIDAPGPARATQANGRGSISAHSASSVVWPYSAGAITVAKGRRDARNRAITSVFARVPGRIDGTPSFASMRSN